MKEFVFVKINFCRAKSIKIGYNKRKGMKGMITLTKMGRPKSENPRSFTVPEVRLTREEKRMFEMKAGFLGGSTAALIRKAVEAYKPQLQENVCCNQVMNIITQEEEIPFEYGDQAYTFRITNIPMWHCDTCDEIEEDFKLMVAVEKTAKHEFEKYLQTGQEIPKVVEMDFRDMLGIKEPEKVAK